LKNLIFTGTEPGAGTTTVATRVREMLETMGRATVMVDASRTPAPPARDAAALGHSNGNRALVAQRGHRPAALLQQVAEETERVEESLVLTDAAPLLVSAETEYLARFVDCAIVVIHSGVTTRVQLREVATSLQRLDVAAVGFVLNRVGLAKADPAFRASVQAMGTHLEAQTRSFARHSGRNQAAVEPAAVELPALPPLHENLIAAGSQPEEPLRRPAAEPVYRPSKATPPTPVAAPVAAPAPVPAAPKAAPAAPAPAAAQVLQPAPAVPVEELVAAVPEPQAVLDWALGPQQELPLRGRPLQPTPLPRLQPIAPQPVAPPAARPAPAAAKTQPEPVRVETQRAETPAAPIPAPPAQAWDRVSPAQEQPNPQAGAVPQQPKPAMAEAAMPEVDDAASQQASRLSGLKDLLSALHQRNLQKAIEMSDEVPIAEEQAPREAERTAYVRSFTPAPEAAPAPRPVAASALQRQVVAQPEFLPPRPPEEPPAKAAPKDNAAARRDRRDNFDEVAILPSWRGQYKKKS
jgi:hypothetical protein